MKKNLLILVCLLPLAVGCTSTKGLVRELAKDNASVVVNISTIYGTARLVRANPPPGGSASITPDGTLQVTGAITNTVTGPVTVTKKGGKL